MRYINHDTSALDDEKISELIIEHGYEGYGLFWAILEKIGKQEKPIKTVVLKKQLKVGKKLEKCWKFMEDISLICSNNGDTFNEQLLNYAGKYKISQEKNAERVSKWRDNQKDAKNVTHYESVRNAPKENIIEEKESKENSSFSADALLEIQQENERLKIQLEEEKKKVAAKKKRKDGESVTQHWQAIGQHWRDFYAGMFNGRKPTMQDVQYTALRGIMKKLKDNFDDYPGTAGQEWTEAIAVDYFNTFITTASRDKWLADHFRLENLNSQFDIIAHKNAKQATTSNDPNAAYAADLARRMAAASQQGTGNSH